MTTTELRAVPTIETGVWEKIPGGYVREVGKRSVGMVATDLEKALTKHQMPYEYVSPTVSLRKEEMTAPWPGGKEGETFVALELGGNEGWSLYVCVRERLKDAHNQRTGEMKLFQPIRIKLLTSFDEAIEVYKFVFHLLGS